MSSLLVFNRVYTVDWIVDNISHVGIFDRALCTIAPLIFSLVHLPPSPLPKVSGWEGVAGCCVVLKTIFCRI